jgi:acetylornithine/N-succinyldiaminopimelate aminotransferase
VLKDAAPSVVAGIRGRGLLIGIEIIPPVGDMVQAAFAEKLLTVPAGDNVQRLLPPLNVTPGEISTGIERLTRAAQRIGSALEDAPPDGAVRGGPKR